MRNIPSNFEMKQIAESFFRDKGTFSIDNILDLMSKAFEVGYKKGHLDGKLQNPIPDIKPLSPSDLKFDTSSGLKWYETPIQSIQSINAATLDELLKKSQL